MPNEVMTGEEQALMQAAQAYSKLNGKITALEDKLRETLTVLEGRNARIEQLERAQAEDADRTKLYEAELYNRMKSLEAERDGALTERNELRVVFASLRAQLDAIELPLASPPRRSPSKKRATNGTSTSEPSLERVGEPNATLPATSIPN